MLDRKDGRRPRGGAETREEHPDPCSADQRGPDDDHHSLSGHGEGEGLGLGDAAEDEDRGARAGLCRGTCGSDRQRGGGGGNPGMPKGTSTLTITGTSGGVRHTLNLTLTVN